MNFSSAIAPWVELQAQTLATLWQVDGLMQRASQSLGLKITGQKYQQLAQETHQAIASVQDLELRMAIAAPMKAGKSTMINAILGQDLLPSRNAAMTTLPTEVVFVPGLTEPILNLGLPLRESFQTAFFRLQEQIQAQGLQTVQEVIAPYPYLGKMAEKILHKAGGVIPEEILGRGKILSYLGALNDIIRLCGLVAPVDNPIVHLEEIPRIYAPFGELLQPVLETFQTPEHLFYQLRGSFVIVDTPGPNEVGEHLRLAHLVSQQIEKSSLVLLILDFTQLRTENTEQLKRDIKAALELRGEENLYVLINKIDQRRRGDLTPAQVQQLVKAEFKLPHRSDRIFEVSARWAFAAANFLREFSQVSHSQISHTEILQLPSSRALAQEVLGIDWEEELPFLSVEQLAQKADRLWQKSGFPAFLSQAIPALVAQATPRCLRSALTLAHHHLQILQDDVQLQCQAMQADEQKLKSGITHLYQDFQALKVGRQKLSNLVSVQTQIHQELEKLFGDLQQATQMSLEPYCQEKTGEKSPEEPSEILNWMSKKLKQPLTIKKSGVLEFKTQREAEVFAGLTVEYAQHRLEALLYVVQESVQEKIEQCRQDFLQRLMKQTQPIIERAKLRLNQDFHMEVSFPQPTLKSRALKFEKPMIARQSQWVEQGYDEKLVDRREWWYWFGFIPWQETVRVKRPDIQKNIYTVSLQEMIPQLNQAIAQTLATLKAEVDQYLAADFQKQIDQFYTELNRYLYHYGEALQQAAQSQKKSWESQTQFLQQLREILAAAQQQMKEVEDCLKLIP